MLLKASVAFVAAHSIENAADLSVFIGATNIGEGTMPWRGGIDAPTLGAGDMKVGNGGDLSAYWFYW